MTDHPSRDTLADAAEGLLQPEEAAVVDAHVAGCPECRAETAAFAEVGTILAGVPAPAMPADVVRRLAGVVAAEQSTREVSPVLHAVPGSGPDAPAVPRHPYGTRRRLNPSLGQFGEDLRRVSAGRRWGLPVLAAAAAAVLLGFVAYVASATLGLNEPPTVSISTSPGQLAAEAEQLLERTDIDPHRFSQAWWCARQVPRAGRIVGLASTTADAQPAVLVYVRSPSGLGVSVVTGCETGHPVGTPWQRIGE